jgi:hypothetical protein
VDKLNLSQVLGILQVLCQVAKSGSSEQVQSEGTPLISLARILQDNATLSVNTIVRKYRTKLISRIAIRLLPAKPVARKNGMFKSVFMTDETDTSVQFANYLVVNCY